MAPLVQGGAILKNKKSLKDLFIPTRQKSQIPIRKESLSFSPTAIEDPILTAIPVDHVSRNPTVGSIMEPPSASSSRAPSSVLSEDSSQRPSSSRRMSRQVDKDVILGAEQMIRSLHSTELSRSGRSRASTLTNFSKPYGSLQEHALIVDTESARKKSHQNLNNTSLDRSHRRLNRVFTDGSLGAGQGQRQTHPRTTSNPLSPTNNTDASSHSNSANNVNFPPSERNHLPWTFAHDDMLKSMHSVQSSGSSVQGSKHSSVFTRIGSSADTMTDTDILDEQKDGISVNEVIDFYADLEDEEEDCAVSPETAFTNERSMRIAEAVTAPIGSLPTPGRERGSSTTAVFNAQQARDALHQPPSLQTPTATHDHYGFRKFSRDVAEDDYNSWYQQYSKFQTRRNAKWHSLLSGDSMSTTKPTKFPAPSSKTQRYIRKGIPPAWRGDAWFFYAGGAELLTRYPNHYVNLVVKSQSDALSRNDKEAVERDLHRTFPDNLHFKSELASKSNQIIETPIMSALRRLLCAFAVDHPRIGYCQSLNFIAGLLLLFLPEEKAYWMLHIMTTQLLPGTHELSLEGANVDLWVLMLALRQANPGVWAKVGGDVEPSSSRLPPISLCTTSWFMSVFIGTLPVESVLRVWDVLFYEGSKTLFRVALAIFKSGEMQIKSVADPMETFQVVQTLPRRMIDVGSLFETAFSRGEVGRRWIEKKRSERRAFYAKERSAEKARRGSRDAGLRRATTSHGEAIISPTTTDTMSMASPETNENRNGYWGKTMNTARLGT